MTTKRIIHMSVGFLLTAVLISAMSACGTVDTNVESSEVISEQSEASFPTEQEIVSIESEESTSELTTSTLLEAYSISTDELENFGYWLYTPENPTENMPLIVYLHGASGRGEDLNLVVADEDFPKYLHTGELGNVRAYVLIPQLPAQLRSWSDIGDSLYSLIQKTVSELSIDEKKHFFGRFQYGRHRSMGTCGRISRSLFQNRPPCRECQRGIGASFGVTGNPRAGFRRCC